MSEDIAEIARKLSRAQRKAVVQAEEIVVGEMNVNCSDAMWDDFVDLGLMTYDCDALTPLGLTVREHLLAQHRKEVGA